MEQQFRISSDNSQISSVYHFHKIMSEKDIMMVYSGEFSQEMNKILLSFTERKFKAENVEDITRRKIFNIMVEVLQNISKNRIDCDIDPAALASVFMIGANDDHYILLSSNIILNDKISNLKERINQINSLDKTGLKQLYKEARLGNSFTDKSGAGIGLIDIARKSENKLEYVFENMNDEISTFSLLVKVNK